MNSCFFHSITKECHPQIPKYERSHFTLWCAKQLLQVNSTEPATAVTALVAKQVYRDACQWVSCNGFSFLPFQYIDNAMQHSTTHWSSNMQLKTVSNGLLQSCSESELAFFCTQLTLNLRNSARTTSQVGLYPLHQQIYVSGSRTTLQRAHQREKGCTIPQTASRALWNYSICPWSMQFQVVLSSRNISYMALGLECSLVGSRTIGVLQFLSA